MAIALAVLAFWVAMALAFWRFRDKGGGDGGCIALDIFWWVIVVGVVVGDIAALLGLITPAVGEYLTWYTYVIWFAPRLLVASIFLVPYCRSLRRSE